MENILLEKKFYNSLAILFRSDFKKMKDLFLVYGSWQGAGESLQANLEVDADWADLEKFGAKLILKNEELFPSLLREIEDCPGGLYYRGELLNWEPLFVGVVGTRKATQIGLDNAGHISTELCRAGGVVVSGLALGVDSEAHRACVKSAGPTVAVLANGLDAVYPRQNEGLAKEILDAGGLILSEYPLFTPPLPRYFLARNRIISGLSRAVIIIEAPFKSGATSTAAFAHSQGRMVFALPGPIASVNYKGTNNLIKTGRATLFSDVGDVLSALDYNQNLARIDTSPTSPLDKSAQIILTGLMIGPDSMDCNQIVESTGLTIEEVNEAVGALVIDDLIGEDGGRYFLLNKHK